MIQIFTKERHIEKIRKFCKENKIDVEIYTVKDKPSNEKCDLGISYCYPRKISNSQLDNAVLGFVNYHPGPLPKYKGPNEFENAIKNKELDWGVTVHVMNEEYDSGPIIKKKHIELHEPPTSIQELGAVSHYFLFELFKETILDIINKKSISK